MGQTMRCSSVAGTGEKQTTDRQPVNAARGETTMKCPGALKPIFRCGRNTAVCALALFSVLSIGTGALRAQAVTGTILGAVRDSSGAPVPSAPVRIESTATGVTRNLTTTTDGLYEAPSLPPGAYSVSVEATGFKKVTAGNVQLNVDEKARVDLTLEVGSVNETVEV